MCRRRISLGETPIWDPEENALYWVDWGGEPTCRFEPATGKFTTFPVSVPVTALARRASGGWIAIAQNGLYEWDPKTNEYQLLVGPPEPDRPEICYNDAAVDRQGRLLVGTVNMQDPFPPEGSLYRLDPDGSLHKLDTGYATANGIGVSPDGRTVYVADQRHRQIIALDYDTVKGTTSNRRIFARVPDDEGMPDGLIVDAEGFIWNGHWAGGSSHATTLMARSSARSVSPCSMSSPLHLAARTWMSCLSRPPRGALSDEERKQQPWAGDLFRVKTGVKGLVEPAFAG